MKSFIKIDKSYLNMNRKIITLSLIGSLTLAPFNESFTIQNSQYKNEVKNDSKKKTFINNAKQYLGIEYGFGGRLTKKNPDLDCLGLIFLAYSKTFNENWTNFNVNPSELVKNHQLGKPVEGLDGILSLDVEVSKLEEGDIIYLLTTNSINDKPLARINEIAYWPWHVGIYSNKEKNLFLEANPLHGVIEHGFDDVLKYNEAIFVTRF